MMIFRCPPSPDGSDSLRVVSHIRIQKSHVWQSEYGSFEGKIEEPTKVHVQQGMSWNVISQKYFLEFFLKFFLKSFLKTILGSFLKSGDLDLKESRGNLGSSIWWVIIMIKDIRVLKSDLHKMYVFTYNVVTN